MPALTMVAAWIRALTVVGPSIALGSHMWRGNWADLPTAPPKRRRVAAVATSTPKKVDSLSRCPFSNISTMFRVPSSTYIRIIPMRKNTSPRRVTKNAFIWALRASGFSCQNPMRRYEHRPMISHAMNIWSRLLDITKMNIDVMKRHISA